MKNRLKPLTQLFEKLRNVHFFFQIGETGHGETKAVNPEIQQPTVLNKQYGNFTATAIIQPGKIALILTKEAYDQLINGLSEADQWTGFPYSEEVFNYSTIIKN